MMTKTKCSRGHLFPVLQDGTVVSHAHCKHCGSQIVESVLRDGWTANGLRYCYRSQDTQPHEPEEA